MNYYADNIPESLIKLFDNIIFPTKNLEDISQNDAELKYKFNSMSAKLKFFGFGKILCGYFQACEQYKIVDAYHSQYFDKLFDELMNFWVYPAFIPEFKLISSEEVIINSISKRGLGQFRDSFKEILLIQFNSSSQLSIVKLYKHWIKNADKYYADLLMDSIKILDNNNQSELLSNNLWQQK